MATDLEKLLVRVEASLKQYEKEMARAQGIGVKALRKIEADNTRTVSRIERSWAKAGTAIKAGVGGFVAGLGVEQLARAAATAIKSVADIGDQAKKLGLTNAEFQELAAAAKFGGSDVEALASAMKKLGVNSSEAARGQGEFSALLKANNVSLADANGKMKSQVEILAIVADLVANAASEQDALAIAQTALGKSGSDLMDMLAGGADGVREAMRFASEEGIKFTDAQIAKAQEFDDKIDLLIDKISIELKGAFVEAAAGAETLWARAGNIQSLEDAWALAKDINEVLGPVGGFEKLKELGKQPGSEIPRVVSAPGKSGLPTVLPTKKAGSDGARAAAQAAKDAARAEEQRRAAIMRVMEAMQFESAQSKRSEREQFIQNELRSAGARLTADEAAQLRRLADARFSEIEAQKSADENKAISIENQKAAIAAQAEANELVMQGIEEQKEGWMQLAELGVSALDAIIIGGEKTTDVLKNMARSLASAALQASLLGQGPLASLFGTSKGGGIFGKIIGGFVGGGVSAGIYHSGGTVGSGGPRRSVPAAAFANAPRYHSGGIAGFKPGEVPAILQKGEVVLPRGAGVGGSGTVVNITMNAQGADASVRAELQRMKKELPKTIKSVISSERRLSPMGAGG